MADVASLALEFIATYGIYAIFVLLVMDAALMLPVFPGELVMVMAVATYANDIPGLLFLIVLTTAAGLLGSLILYGITRGGGRRLVERFPRFFMMPRKRRERLERVFQRPAGQSLVFFLRLVPLTRVLVNIPAGLARMPIVRFVVLSTIGLLGYHAAFLWFTYEVQRPGSTIATQKEQLEQAYASPAMAFVEANSIVTALVLLGIGAVVSVRASVAMRRDPEESAGSLLGWAATMVLLWGGAALGVATYLQPEAVEALADLGGVELESLSSRFGYTTTQLLFGTAAGMFVLGGILRALNRSARAHRRRHIAEKRVLARMAAEGRLSPASDALDLDAPAAAAPPQADAPQAPGEAGESLTGEEREWGAALAGPAPTGPRPIAEAEDDLRTRKE